MTTAELAVAKKEEESGDAMTSISRYLSALRPAGFSNGDHATLRRMFLKRESVFEGVVVKLLLSAGVDRRAYERDFSAWRLVAHVAALLSGTARLRAHDSRRGLGLALEEAGLSENRLMRLTAARGAALHDQLAVAGRMMAQRGAEPTNLWTLLDLAGSDPKKAERARIRIVQDYYTAARQQGDDT